MNTAIEETYTTIEEQRPSYIVSEAWGALNALVAEIVSGAIEYARDYAELLVSDIETDPYRYAKALQHLVSNYSHVKLPEYPKGVSLDYGFSTRDFGEGKFGGWRLDLRGMINLSVYKEDYGNSVGAFIFTGAIWPNSFKVADYESCGTKIDIGNLLYNMIRHEFQARVGASEPIAIA